MNPTHTIRITALSTGISTMHEAVITTSGGYYDHKDGTRGTIPKSVCAKLLYGKDGVAFSYEGGPSRVDFKGRPAVAYVVMRDCDIDMNRIFETLDIAPLRMRAA
jgi:hypothetical protein